MGLSRKLLPFVVLVAWILITVMAIPLSGRLSEVAGNPDSVELPRGSEATEVAALSERFPDSGTATGILVYVRAGGITAADRAKAATDRQALAPLAGAAVAPVRASTDGEALALSLPLRRDPDGGITGTARAVRDLAYAGAPPGLEIRFSGTAGAALDAGDASERIARIAMIVTVVVVVVLLLLTYRSPLLWLLPVLSVGVAYLASDAVMYLLGRYFGVTVSTGNAAVVTVLVFGVGTDYALLLLARYREELRREPDRRVAMAAALRGAVPAIAASAATVSLGLLCLLAADMGFNYTLGPAGAVAVLSALLVMVTLLPALLVILGRWIFWPVIPRPGGQPKHSLLWHRIGAMVSRRPRPVWVGAALVLGLLACGALGMRTGLDGEHRFAATPASVAGQRLLAEHFGTRTDALVQVVVAPAAVDAITAVVRAVPGVVEVATAVTAVDGTLSRIDATMADPPDSAAAAANVDRVRAAVRAVPGAHALVGGPTAVRQAVTQAQSHDRNVVIPLVLAVVFLVLVFLLRALVASALLMATVVASYFAALGTAWFAFRHVFGFPAMDTQVMLIGFLFLVALGVDYNIFLVSRIRQEVARHGHRDGVLRGLSVTGGVITNAGIVLAATFAVLLLAPYVAFVEIGFLIAVGVLIDTLLVRSILVPALALDVGPRFWWPSVPTPSGDRRDVPVRVTALSRPPRG
jgi:RND superfamily putative drug exporter